MSIELDWHEGDESPDITWETAPEPLPTAALPPSTIARGHRARGGAPDWLPRFLISVLAGLLLGLAILAGILFWRSGQGNDQALLDIADASELVLNAWKNRDLPLYSELLDSGDSAWKSRMVAALRSTSPPESILVEEVELDGPVALATVTETGDDGTQLRKLAFYRLIDGQWRLSAPQPDRFGATVDKDSTHFRITVRERDERFLPDLVNLAEGTYVILCGELRCRSASQPILLRLAYDVAAVRVDPAAGEISVHSPWLIGRTPDGRPTAAFEQELVRQIARILAADKAPHTPPAVLQAIGDWAAADLAGAAVPGGETLPQALQNGTLLPLDLVWRQANSQPHIANPLVSAQLHTLLSFAQTTLVDDAVGRLLEAGSGPLPTVLQRAFEVDATTFATDWLRWLNSAFPAAAPQAG